MRVQFFFGPLRPVATLQRGVERMAHSWWDLRGALPSASRGIWSPPTDVYETATDLMVKVEVAGTTEDQIQVYLYQDCLLVSGKRDERKLPAQTVIHQMDIWYGDFRAEVPIPVAVDAERVEANYENGMVCVKLPKLIEEAPQPTHVSISVPNE